MPIPSPQLDEKGHDTAFYIFHELFHCTIPEMERRSIEDIQMFGVPASGYAQWDSWMANERREIMLPINKDQDGPSLLLYHRRGAAIRMRQEEARKVYDRITNHLTAWRHHLEWSLNVGQAPLEDLRDLDKLAHALYENAGAKYLFDDEIIETMQRKLKGRAPHVMRSLSLAQAMENAQIVDGKFVPAPKTPEGMPVREIPTRESMADAFLPKQGANSRSLNQQRIVPSSGMPSLNGGEAPDPSLTRKPSTLAELMARGRKGIAAFDQPT